MDMPRWKAVMRRRECGISLTAAGVFNENLIKERFAKIL